MNKLNKSIKTVSIITPCYNASDYIYETYSSLKDQTYPHWEWIVFDDCSTDKSLSLLQEISLTDNRLKVFKNDSNSGAAITRNNCLKKASGSLIAFLDCDDLWVPSKLELQVSFLENNPCSLIYSNYEMIDEKGKPIKIMATPPTVTVNSLLKFNPFATSSVMINSQIIKENDIKFKEHLRRRQDYLFWYDIIKIDSPAKRINQPLSKYRQVGSSSLSSNKKNMAIIQWGLLREEFKLNYFLSVYYFIHYAIHGIKKYFL